MTEDPADRLSIPTTDLLSLALAGDRAAEDALRDWALIDEQASEAYLVALQAAVARERQRGGGSVSALTVAVSDQVSAFVHDLLRNDDIAKNERWPPTQ